MKPLMIILMLMFNQAVNAQTVIFRGDGKTYTCESTAILILENGAVVAALKDANCLKEPDTPAP